MCPSWGYSKSICVPFVRGDSSLAQRQRVTVKDESSAAVTGAKHHLQRGEQILFFPLVKRNRNIYSWPLWQHIMRLLTCDTTDCTQRCCSRCCEFSYNHMARRGNGGTEHGVMSHTLKEAGMLQEHSVQKQPKQVLQQNRAYIIWRL